jgi:hypothetical protein
MPFIELRWRLLVHSKWCKTEKKTKVNPPRVARFVVGRASHYSTKASRKGGDAVILTERIFGPDFVLHQARRTLQTRSHSKWERTSDESLNLFSKPIDLIHCQPPPRNLVYLLVRRGPSSKSSAHDIVDYGASATNWSGKLFQMPLWTRRTVALPHSSRLPSEVQRQQTWLDYLDMHPN